MLVRFYLLFAVVVWGWTFVATKVCLGYLEPLELLALRFAIGFPVLLVLARLRRISLHIATRDRRSLALGALVFLLHFVIQITGLKYTTAMNTSWIIAVTPLVMAVLGFLFLRERLTRKEIIGVILATIGILLLVSKGDLTSLGWLSSIGDWLVLLSAHTWALYTIATRNPARGNHPLVVTFYVLLPTLFAAGVWVLFTSDLTRFLHLPAEVVIALLFLGILGTALAQWFWQEGVAAIGASRAGIYLYLEPLATTALAVPYLGEELGLFTALGGLLVLAGVWWAQRRASKQT